MGEHSTIMIVCIVSTTPLLLREGSRGEDVFRVHSQVLSGPGGGGGGGYDASPGDLRTQMLMTLILLLDSRL